MNRALAILLMLCGGASAANWYLDHTATAGSNAGTSWANAWTNPASCVFGGGGVIAGDTLYVSSGSYTSITVTASGTEGNPIRLKASQEVGHNSLVTFYSIGVWGNWVTVDGAKDDSITVTNVYNLWSITNNIGLVSSAGIWPGSGNDQGIVLKWIEIKSVTPSPANQAERDAAYGVKFNGDDPFYGCELSYLFVNNVGYDAINGTGQNSTNFGGLVIHHSILWQPNDDGYEGVACTIHHSILARARRQGYAGSDPDATQTTGNYFRFYNNIAYDWGNSIFQNQGQDAEGGYYGNHQIYGNVFYYDLYPFISGQPAHTTELESKWYPASAAWNRTNISYRDWIVANNTFCRMNLGCFQWEARVEHPDHQGWIRNIAVSNIYFLNNCFLSVTGAHVGLPRGTNIQNVGETPGTNYWTWGDTNKIVFDYNIFATNFGQLCTINYGQQFTNGEALADATQWKSNWSTVPMIVDLGGYDFRPIATDTVIRNRGTNIASLNLPGWTNDLYGIARGTTPSIGAAEESTETGLVVWLQMEDSFADGKLDDASGNGNHAYRFGRPASSYPTNFPVQTPVGNMVNRTNNAAGKAGEFRWYSDGWGLYGRSGAYAAITNVSGLTNLNRATIAVWARYYHYDTNSCADYTCNQNAALISAGDSQGINGGWQLSRFQEAINLNETRFTVHTNAGGFDRHVINFPEGNIISSGGETTNWHHYAVTWNNGIVTAYYDGVAFQTNNISALITNLTIDTYSYAAPGWIGIGCQTHSGNPSLDDEPPPGDADTSNDYPNHGWMSGFIDDVRIYNRVLSAADVLAIVNGSAVGAASIAGGIAVSLSGNVIGTGNISFR